MDAELKSLIYDALSLTVMTLLPILLGYLTVWLREKYGAERVATAVKTLHHAYDIAQQSVDAVEQLSAKAGWDSPTKKMRAIVLAKTLAVKSALQLSDEQWDTLIETAVKNIRDFGNEFKRVAPPAA